MSINYKLTVNAENRIKDKAKKYCCNYVAAKEKIWKEII